MPYNFAADSFHTNKLCSTLSSSEVQFYIRKRQNCAFEAPFGGLRATYDVHLRLIGKLVGDFLLVIMELFSLGAFVLSQYTRLTDGQTDGQTDRISTAIPCVYASHSRTIKKQDHDTDSTEHDKTETISNRNLPHYIKSRPMYTTH